jgi:hypothetical protein
METFIVIIIVGIAVGLLGRHYYKKYKKGHQCRGGCSCCTMDTSSGESPEKRDPQLTDIRETMQN